MGKVSVHGPCQGASLIIIDVQKDFLLGGSLAVPGGDSIVPILNRYIQTFQMASLPIFATRDWHPPGHCSFREQGGPWPPHCVAGSLGAEFASGLNLPPDVTVISTSTTPIKEAYSGFEDTDLDQRLRMLKVRRLFIGGLATDYCVLNTVKDALANGYDVLLLVDAIRAVNVQPEDGLRAVEEMKSLGAQTLTLEEMKG